MMTTMALLFIFTTGGDRGRLMPPTVVEFPNPQACLSAAENLRAVTNTSVFSDRAIYTCVQKKDGAAIK